MKEVYLKGLDDALDTALREALAKQDGSDAAHARLADLLSRTKELAGLGGVSFQLTWTSFRPRGWLTWSVFPQELPPSAERFLASFLPGWDGAAHRAVIFDLIALYKPTPLDSEPQTALLIRTKC